MFFLFIRLKEWWREIFSFSERFDSSFHQCPMLIGVMPEIPQGRMPISSFQYQYRVLLSCQRLPQTGQTSTAVKVLETLRAFREECHRNQRPLVAVVDQRRMDEIDTSDTFDFGRLTGLCPDILVEITQFLWLDETINAFSISILPLLHQTHTKVHLVNPSNRFLERIVEHLDPRQIVSVRVDDKLRTWERDFSPSRVFNRLISSILINVGRVYATDNILDGFPNIRVLSVWFNGELNFDDLRHLRSLISSSINRLHIRCVDYICRQSSRSTRFYLQPPNTEITSFIFDSSHYQWSAENVYPLHHSPEDFTSIMEFIQSLVNIRHVRFITNRFRIEALLQVNHWRQLIRKCLHLRRMTIPVMNHAEFAERAKNIEEELRQLRPGVIFRVVTA